MKIKVTFAAHQGLRRVYADAFLTSAAASPPDPPCAGAAETDSAKTFFAAVCDGIGEERGREAALKAVQGIRQHWERTADEREDTPLAELALALADAGRAALSSLPRGGTTLALAVIRGDGYAAVNVGDSPLFLVRRACALELSVRDNLYWHKKRNRFSAAPEDKSLLLAALGSFSPMHVREGTLLKGDRLLLCTDGLDPLLSERLVNPAQPDLFMVESPLRAALRSRKGLESRLTHAAHAGGDNTTAIVLEAY